MTEAQGLSSPTDGAFWAALDALLRESRIVIDRPQGSRHPRYPDLLYPYDYGYLEATQSADGQGIDLWRGSLPETRVTGIVSTVDLLKRDAELKLLVGCSRAEMLTIHAFLNQGTQQGLLTLRPESD